MSQRHYLGAMLAFAVSLATAAVPSVASAQERSACVAVNRANLIDCALKASLSLRSEAWATQAAEGRLQAASPWLPSNPVLAFALAHREEIGGQRSDQNWTAGLSQELEIAGQRAPAERSRVPSSTRPNNTTVWSCARWRLPLGQPTFRRSLLVRASRQPPAWKLR